MRGTYTEDGKARDGRVTVLQGLDIVRDLPCDLWRRIRSEEVTQLLLLFIRVRRVAGVGRVSSLTALGSQLFTRVRCCSHLDRARLALEPVRNKDLVLLVIITVRKDICALDSLVEVAEDVVDDENGLGSILGTSNVCDEASVSKCVQRNCV